MEETDQACTEWTPPAPISVELPDGRIIGPGSDTAAQRKATPVASGFIDYFPLAIQEVARLSLIANEQHNPGTKLHWDRSKSGDESDALMRHFIDRGKLDEDGIRHSAKVAWRGLALLEKELEAANEHR